jgi:peroxiredoxin
MSRDRAGITDDQGRFRFSGLTRNLHYRVTPTTEGFQSDCQIIHQGQPVNWVTLDENHVAIEVQAKKESELTRAPDHPHRPPAELACRTWINDEPPALTALRGKVVLLHFWGVANERSVGELPTLQRAHDAFASQGLVIVGVHHSSTSAERVRQLVKALGLTFPIGLDNSDESSEERYGIIQVPTQILIGRDGRVIPANVNANRWTAIRTAVLYGEAE